MTAAAPVVYTALYGGHDELCEPTPQDIEVRWVCFTDDPTLRSTTWEVVVQPALGDDPRMSAKWSKTQPHLVLPDAPLTIWLDASIVVDHPGFVREALAALGPAPFAAFRHPYRNCIYTEATASTRLGKYDGLPILDQVEHYRAEGHPRHWGLWAGGALVRRSLDARIAELGTAWWDECVRWTYQDQLSLPPVCRRLGLRPLDLPHHLHRHGPVDGVVCLLHRLPGLDALANRRPARSNLAPEASPIPPPGPLRRRLIPSNPWFSVRTHRSDD